MGELTDRIFAGDRLDGETDGLQQGLAGALTPVPGGVGPLTNLMLLEQCVAGPSAVEAATPL